MTEYERWVEMIINGKPKEKKVTTVDSTSDDRVINNVMRHAYRVLNDDEKRQMQAIKDKGLEFMALLHDVGGTLASFETTQGDVRLSSRELSLAGTKVEEAVMWAVKHITR